MPDHNETQKVEQLSRPERLFKIWSGWIGTFIFGVSMYSALFRDIEPPIIVFAVGGMMMGAGKALELAKGMKP